MFLDEPTSGLDSGAAFNIVRFLRKLADSGQALLVTIHQPSSVLFEYFDELILLKSGGRVVYHGGLGKDSRHLIDYFERNGAHKCPPRANPAEYMLEAIGAGDPNYKGKDWGDVWASSPQYEERTQEIQSMISTRLNAPLSDRLKDDREYAMPLGTQVSAVVRRSFVNYWRDPDYMIGKFMLHIFTGLFNSFTFYHIGFESIDMQSRLFSIFMTLTISPPLIQQLQPKFLHFRNLYSSREKNSKIYSWFAMTTGAILVELPYSIVAGTLYFQCWWWPAIGHHASKLVSAYTWMMLMLFELYYVGFGQAIASFSANELLASLLVPIFFLFVVSFCGVVVPFAALPHVSLSSRKINKLQANAKVSTVLAILDVLPHPIHLPPRRPPRRRRPRSTRQMRPQGIRPLPTPTRPNLPILHLNLHPASRRVRPRRRQRPLRILPVCPRRRIRGRVQRVL